MENIEIKYNGKTYKAVELEFDGEYVIVAEEDLNDVLTTDVDNYNPLACDIDNSIFVFAPKSIIENGSETELCNFIKEFII